MPNAYRVGVWELRLQLLLRAGQASVTDGEVADKEELFQAGRRDMIGYRGPRLPVTAARRMRWLIVRAVIEGRRQSEAVVGAGC